MQKLQRFLDKLSDGWALGVLTLIGVLAIGVSIGIHIADAQDRNWWGWVDSLSQNFGAGMIGALVTFLLVDRIIGKRELKARLIREMRSNVRDIAVQAVNELRVHGWLEDGTLEHANLFRANLQGANLSYADLQRASLFETDLQGADLDHANLRQVGFGVTKLQGVDLWNADLQNAGFANAYLKGANLEGANLQDASFANISRDDIVFDEMIILPDRTYWKPGTDLSRFTDPNHPDFWRSDDPDSPAYHGDKSQSRRRPALKRRLESGGKTKEGG